MTETEYEAAIRRIKELWFAQPGSDEETELNDLCERAEEYEKENFRIVVSTEGT